MSGKPKKNIPKVAITSKLAPSTLLTWHLFYSIQTKYPVCNVAKPFTKACKPIGKMTDPVCA